MFPMGGCLTFIQKERSEYQILRNNNNKKKKKRKRWKGKEIKKKFDFILPRRRRLIQKYTDSKEL